MKTNQIKDALSGITHTTRKEETKQKGQFYMYEDSNNNN